MRCISYVLTNGGLGMLAAIVAILSKTPTHAQPQSLANTPVHASGFVWLQSSELDESSGIAQVGGREIWSHNDSGDKPRFFVFGQDGQLRSEVAVQGASAVDWEDMCSFTRDGKQYIAVGDVGDNLAQRTKVFIYVMELPLPGLVGQVKTTAGKTNLNVTAVFEVRYPEGPVNCETLAYDPVRRSFVLASKELLRCRLFEVSAESLSGQYSIDAVWKHTLALPLVTGGDISPDGQLLVLSTYGPGCLLHRSGEDWQTQGENTLLIFELPARRQGESICFSNDGQRLFLSSEFAPSPLYDIPVPKLLK